MARKKPGPKPQAGGRMDVKCEFMVPFGWKEQVDAVAQALGLNFSAYVRLAVNERMARDAPPPAEPGQTR